LIFLLAMMAVSTPSVAQFPDLALSTATATPGSILISPAGTGDALSDVGSTITVTLLDPMGDPLPGFPAQDVWIGRAASDPYGTLALCTDGSIADGPSDTNGTMTFGGAISGGGQCSGVQVYILGSPLLGPPLDIEMNSPDIDGNLVINTLDFGSFSIDYGGSAFRSDYDFSGEIDLIDFGQFASRFSESCP
jgi:hypothetical protein